MKIVAALLLDPVANQSIALLVRVVNIGVRGAVSENIVYPIQGEVDRTIGSTLDRAIRDHETR